MSCVIFTKCNFLKTIGSILVKAHEKKNEKYFVVSINICTINSGSDSTKPKVVTERRKRKLEWENDREKLEKVYLLQNFILYREVLISVDY